MQEKLEKSWISAKSKHFKGHGGMAFGIAGQFLQQFSVFSRNLTCWKRYFKVRFWTKTFYWNKQRKGILKIWRHSCKKLRHFHNSMSDLMYPTCKAIVLNKKRDNYVMKDFKVCFLAISFRWNEQKKEILEIRTNIRKPLVLRSSPYIRRHLWNREWTKGSLII